MLNIYILFVPFLQKHSIVVQCFPFKQRKAKLKHTKLLIKLHQPTQCLKHSSGRIVDRANAIKPSDAKANLISAHFV